MSVNLKVNIGQVNFDNFLRVTAAKVSNPGVVVWQTYIEVPFTQYNLVIPNLDPENYFISYYEAPTTSDNGVFYAQLFANALTGQIEYERRFYTVGGPGTNDPIQGSTHIIDPYLIDKDVTGVFKEAFRFLNPATEYTFDNTTGDIEITNGTDLNNDEQVIVDIKYNGGTQVSNNAGGLYTGTLDVTDAAYTLVPDDTNKRIRCRGTSSSQAIKLPLIAAMADDDGFYFDNSTDGVAKQVVLDLQGDKVLFNGFELADNLLTEFWVSKGEHFLMRKSGSNWEILTDYKGTTVGERVNAGFRDHPGTVPEDGAILNAVDYPRLYWWVKNVLNAQGKYTTTDLAIPPDISSPDHYRAQFGLHATLPLFRMPDTRGLVDKTLTDYDGGNDPMRIPNRPGVFQAEMVKSHGHRIKGDNTGGSGGSPYALNRAGVNVAGAQRTGSYLLNNGDNAKIIEETGGLKNLVDNQGVFSLRRI